MPAARLGPSGISPRLKRSRPDAYLGTRRHRHATTGSSVTNTVARHEGTTDGTRTACSPPSRTRPNGGIRVELPPETRPKRIIEAVVRAKDGQREA